MAFLAATNFDPIRAAGDLGYGFMSWTPHGRAVRKDPQTFEEAEQQMRDHEEEVQQQPQEEVDEEEVAEPAAEVCIYKSTLVKQARRSHC